MKLNPARLIEREFIAHFKACTAEIIERRLSETPKEEQAEYRKRQAELHPSSFPYCGYRQAYEELVEEDDPLVYSDFSGDYYMKVGSLAHLIFQKWVGRMGQIAGNWSCDACGHIHKLRTMPKRCKSCKHPNLTYEEVGGTWGKSIHWHKDGIYIDKQGRKWVIDYKTSSTRAIETHNAKGGKFPYLSNKMQAESYVILAEDEYEEDIAGWILLYVGRDFPAYTSTAVAQLMDKERKAEVRARLELDDKNFRRVKRIRKKPELLKPLRKYKLCDTHKFYKENIHASFDECPLHNHCFDKKKIDRVFKQAFKGIPITVKD